jgi:putative serine protease PepD
VTEQNRPADESGHGTDRIADADSSWAPPTPPPTAQPYGAAPVQPAQPFGTPSGQQPTTQFPAYGSAPHQGWPPAGWGQQPGAFQAGGHLGSTAVFPPAGAVQDAAQAQPSRRAGRWRLGVAGLVAGALIGGGAGAGVATLAGNDGGSAPSAVSAQSVVIKNPESATSATAAAAKAAPSVVTIYVSSGSGAGSGSGVVLTADGYVLTNNHVVTLDSSVDNATIQVRTADGALHDASVVGTDPTSDLAVVKLANASGLTAATFADSSKVQVGDLAIAIGAPLGLSNTVTDGIISATNRAVATGSNTDQTVIDALQTDAAINPGNSGGALVDAAGEVVGINSAIATVASSDLPGQNSGQSGNIGVGFAIPTNTAKRIADEIVKTGKATHALLGVSARTATAPGASSEVGTGAELVQVQEGTAASDAGLKAGDVVTAVGDRAVTTSTELTAAVRSSKPGDQVTLTTRRGNATSTVQVTLDAAAN